MSNAACACRKYLILFGSAAMALFLSFTIVATFGRVMKMPNVACRKYLILLGSAAMALLLFLAIPAMPAEAQPPDFDGQTLEVKHVTADSTGCLDVKYGKAADGQDVQTWECNETNAQKWTFEKRTSGDYKDSYRLVSKLGNYCLDNRGDFATGDRMGIWSCVGDSHDAAANQSVTIAVSGEGYTLTFERDSDSKSVWLTTDRTSSNPKGGAGQTTVSGSAPASAVWRIGSDAQIQPANNPPPPANDDPPPAQPQVQQDDTPSADPYDGKTFIIKHSYKDSNWDTTGCLNVSGGSAQDGQTVNTAACDESDAQKWTFEKRTSGDYKDSYALVSNVGGDTHCLDNAGVFNGVEGMTISTCLSDSSATADQQSLTLTPVTGGFTFTFTEKDTNKFTRLASERGVHRTDGPVGQNLGNFPVYFRIVWQMDVMGDFDGRVLRIYHVTDDSTGCLAVPDERAWWGQDVVTAECADHANQYWQFEKFTSGAHSGKYWLRNMMRNQTLCLDNNGEFETSAKMTMELCAEKTNRQLTTPTFKANQVVDVAASGDGYTITFVKGSDSSWLSADRASDSPSGGVGQTTVADTAPASAVWGIGTDADRKAGRTNAPLVVAPDPYDGKIFKIVVRYKAGRLGLNGYVGMCLTPLPYTGHPSPYMWFPAYCGPSLQKTYEEENAVKVWKIEKRASGAFAGYYRLVNQGGQRNLCLDADVDDALDKGNEYTTSPAKTKHGMHSTACVDNSHADVGSQSVEIAKLPDKGAYGKSTYTITFADGTGSDANKVWLATLGVAHDGNYAGQLAVSDTVHEFATIYLEEQPVAMDPP